MSYWDRQQNRVSIPTLAIQDLIREGVIFSEWPEREKKTLCLAMSPREPMMNGENWTPAGRQSLNLIRHLIKRGHFTTLPKIITDTSSAVSQEEFEQLMPNVMQVRIELVAVTPTWALDGILN